MPIHVLTERTIALSNRERVLELLQHLRVNAMTGVGYQLGTIWEELENPNIIVTLDSWSTVEHWTQYQRDQANHDILLELDALITRPSTVRIYGDLSAEGAVKGS